MRKYPKQDKLAAIVSPSPATVRTSRQVAQLLAMAHTFRLAKGLLQKEVLQMDLH